jgi:hypothetical protein
LSDNCRVWSPRFARPLSSDQSPIPFRRPPSSAPHPFARTSPAPPRSAPTPGVRLGDQFSDFPICRPPTSLVPKCRSLTPRPAAP